MNTTKEKSTEITSGQTVASIRAGLDPLPLKMAHLPRDKRGYPVPWFVEWVKGEPEFRATSLAKVWMAIQHRRCWVCGGELSTRYAFVAGPMCGINRTTSEPPAHLECARWSARNCPFLKNPDMVRRQDQLVNDQSLRDKAPGFAITRNPGVTMLWITRSFEVFDPAEVGGSRGVLITMGRPQAVEWFREGRAATRAEVLESIEDGLPNLENLAKMESGGMEDLRRKTRALERWLP